MDVKGFAEVVAGLEALNQSAPETPVVLMSVKEEAETLFVFYDVSNARELGHFRIPEVAPTSD
jgi:hypothetical protein